MLAVSGVLRAAPTFVLMGCLMLVATIFRFSTSASAATTTHPLALEWNSWGSFSSRSQNPHTFNHGVVSNVNTEWTARPSIFTIGLTETCQFQADQVQSLLAQGAPLPTISLRKYKFAEEADNAGCDTDAPPGAPPAQASGDFILTAGTQIGSASTSYGDGTKAGYVCLKVSGFFQSWTCLTHLSTNTTKRWTEAEQFDDFIRANATSVAHPVVMGDFNFNPGAPPASTGARDVLKDFFNGFASMPSMTESADAQGAGCPAGSSYYYTCDYPWTHAKLIPNTTRHQKIDYVWLDDLFAPKQGYAETFPWLPEWPDDTQYLSDHSFVFGGN